ncbi:MAG: hypothetical protein N3A38_11370, partial [Planctomycetota bacterium]|nr:hypothetical protein [Planctomycetota bacterium]
MSQRTCNRDRVLACAFVGLALGAGAWATAAEPPKAAEAKGTKVFDEFTFWRARFAHAAPVARIPEGDGLWPSKEFTIDGPPAEWIQADFDDSGWVWTPGPFFQSDGDNRCGFSMNEAASVNLALLCLRKTFEVADP